MSDTFRFGDAFAIYVGYVDDIDLHLHAAYQVVLSATSDVTISNEHGQEWCGSAFLIKPLSPHVVSSKNRLTLIYIDPQSRLALDLMDRVDTESICTLSDGLLPIGLKSSPDAIFASLQQAAQIPASHLDQRLLDALDDLGENPGTMLIADAANRHGISESRLRTLARQQLGVPISTWLIWRKLEYAARQLSLGASLADAAVAGGFADQAHFSREMRRMFGVTPKAAADALR